MCRWGVCFVTASNILTSMIHRIDMHNVLLDACRQDELVTLVPDAMMVRFDDCGDGVNVTDRGWPSFRGAAMVGADGVRSRTRAQLIGDGEPPPNGFMAFRTIVPMSDVTADVRRDVVALWVAPASTLCTIRFVTRHCSISWRCSEDRFTRNGTMLRPIVPSWSMPTATPIRR